MLAKAGVPLSHSIAADNYMVIKKVYGTPVIKSRITYKELALLGKYDFNQLEYSTINQINEELELLKRWSLSLDETLKSDADKIIVIEDGKISGMGTHEELLSSNAEYQEIYESQNGKEVQG